MGPDFVLCRAKVQALGCLPFQPQENSHSNLANFAYMRLGLPLPLCDNIQSCECGRVTSDSSGYHQMVCKTGGGSVWSHDSITSVWSECLNDLKIHHRKEPKDRYATSDSLPDITVFKTGVGSNVELDI